MTRTAKRQRNKNLRNHQKLPKVNDFFYLEIHSEILLQFSYIVRLNHRLLESERVKRKTSNGCMGDEPDMMARLMIR